jgi:hypothetical protein
VLSLLRAPAVPVLQCGLRLRMEHELPSESKHFPGWLNRRGRHPHHYYFRKVGQLGRDTPLSRVNTYRTKGTVLAAARVYARSLSQ